MVQRKNLTESVARLKVVELRKDLDLVELDSSVRVEDSLKCFVKGRVDELGGDGGAIRSTIGSCQPEFLNKAGPGAEPRFSVDTLTGLQKGTVDLRRC